MWGHIFLILGQQSESLAPTEPAVLIQLKKECVEREWVGAETQGLKGSQHKSKEHKNIRAPVSTEWAFI